MTAPVESPAATAVVEAAITFVAARRAWIRLRKSHRIGRDLAAVRARRDRALDALTAAVDELDNAS